MARKIVGITCGVSAATDTRAERQQLNRAYTRAIEQAGGIPVILPVTDDAEAVLRYLDAVDGLLLSGGADIDPAYYNQARHVTVNDIEPDRDLTETVLVCEALERDIPIFGICRGLQTLNVALGGTLYQDLPSERPSSIYHRQMDAGLPPGPPSHDIEIMAGSRLRAIVDAPTWRVNSRHHQALRDVAGGLTITALAPDGIIEAAEIPAHRYVVAVQFHPEDTAPNDPVSQRLFAAFVAAL